jgi:divalent metal cation (Fe/Co/Zn/Cd) transporter
MATAEVPLEEGATRLAKHDTAAVKIDVLAIALMGGCILAKVGLYIVCKFVLLQTSTTEIFASDHRNDLVLNSFGVTFFAIAGYLPKVWWLDPAGGIVLALWVIYNWVGEGLEFARGLIGQAADPDFMQQLTVVALAHSPLVDKIDTVRAFSFGADQYIVEVDIVLPENMTVRESHDIGETLQHRLEEIPAVAKAIVHIDYEYSHGAVNSIPGEPVTWKLRK